MEAEAREILSGVVTDGGKKLREEGLGTAIHKSFAALGGVDLKIPPRRKSHRPVPMLE
jgi:plasmid stability protein